MFDTRFVRKPFQVNAVQLTEENIHEIAEKLGEVRTNPEDGKLMISLDRRVVPNVGRAYLGWWVTMLGDNYRCYSPKVFSKQFMTMPTSKMVTYSFPSEVEKEVVFISDGWKEPGVGSTGGIFVPSPDDPKLMNDAAPVIHVPSADEDLQV